MLTASLIYADDFKDFFPSPGPLDGPDPARLDTDISATNWTGLALLYFTGYLNKKAIMFCPSQTKYTEKSTVSPKGFGAQEYTKDGAKSYVYSGYFYLASFYCSWGTKGEHKNIIRARGPGLRRIARPGVASAGIPQIVSPAEEVLMMDIVSNKNENSRIFESESSHMDGGSLRGANIGYTDGHVAWKNGTKLEWRDGLKISGSRFLYY